MGSESNGSDDDIFEEFVDMDCDDLGDESVPGVGETVLRESELGNLGGMTIEGEGDEFPSLDYDGKDSDFIVGSGSNGSDDDIFEEFVNMDCDDKGEGSVLGVGETVLGEGELGNLGGMTIEGEGDEFPSLDDDGKDSDFTVGSGSHGSDDDLFDEFVDMDCDDEGEGDEFPGLDYYNIGQDMTNEVVVEEVADCGVSVGGSGQQNTCKFDVGNEGLGAENDEEDTPEENLVVGSDEEWEELLDSEDEGTVRRRGVSTTFPKFNPLDV
ncbi:uncharacterized protein LOC127263903 [Andrographis paniculata]|uniref:uncharacterized protein LOC127263903 n=1 Tax=Andrographis paniculata TaxID=175694 RepID=UPI0021E8F76E|nr:uncharacterized protein LOC127263903 [Andrographis paniculata]